MSDISSRSKYGRRRLPNPAARAWIALLVLSAASAILTLTPLAPNILGAGILILALAKSRMILAHYLDLASSPGWLRGFTMGLTGFALLIFALSLI